MTQLIDNEVKVKLLHRLILASWLMLAICFVIKICGANIFQIACNNDSFIAFCNYIDNHAWSKYIVGCISSFCSVSLFILAIIRQYKFKLWQMIVVIITILGGCAIKLWNSYVGLGVDVIQFMILPMIFLGKPSKIWLNIIWGNIFNILFQVISMIIKNINLRIFDNNSILSLIFMIDVNIMLFLYYLYSNLRRENMGIFFGWFLGKDITKLQEIKNKNLAKIEKTNDEKVKADLVAQNKLIDERIAKLNDKTKQTAN